MLRPGGRVVLLTTLTRIMEGAFATHKYILYALTVSVSCRACRVLCAVCRVRTDHKWFCCFLVAARSRWTTQPRRALINNGGLNTYLFVATRREDPRDSSDDDGLSNRERKRRRARAWHAAQASLEAAAATAAEPSVG